MQTYNFNIDIFLLADVVFSLVLWKVVVPCWSHRRTLLLTAQLKCHLMGTKKKSNDFKHKQKWWDFAFISWKKKKRARASSVIYNFPVTVSIILRNPEEKQLRQHILDVQNAMQLYDTAGQILAWLLSNLWDAECGATDDSIRVKPEALEDDMFEPLWTTTTR